MWRYFRGLVRYCVTFASQRVSLIVIPFCLSVWMSVGHSATYSLPRLIDHNQIWSEGIYLSSDPCKTFGSPVSHTLSARGKHTQNFAYFQRVFLPLRTWRIVPYDLFSFLLTTNQLLSLTAKEIGNRSILGEVRRKTYSITGTFSKTRCKTEQNF